VDYTKQVTQILAVYIDEMPYVHFYYLFRHVCLFTYPGVVIFYVHTYVNIVWINFCYWY